MPLPPLTFRHAIGVSQWTDIAGPYSQITLFGSLEKKTILIFSVGSSSFAQNQLSRCYLGSLILRLQCKDTDGYPRPFRITLRYWKY